MLVVKGVLTSLLGEAQFTVSETGTLAYAPGAVYSNENELLFSDHQGNVEALLEDRQDFAEGVRYSPGGTKGGGVWNGFAIHGRRARCGRR